MNIDRLPADIVIAANRISDYVRETPLDFSSYFSDLSGANVYLKLENLQRRVEEMFYLVKVVLEYLVMEKNLHK